MPRLKSRVRIPFPAPKEIKGLAQKANPFFLPIPPLHPFLHPFVRESTRINVNNLEISGYIKIIMNVQKQNFVFTTEELHILSKYIENGPLPIYGDWPFSIVKIPWLPECCAFGSYQRDGGTPPDLTNFSIFERAMPVFAIIPVRVYAHLIVQEKIKRRPQRPPLSWMGNQLTN